MGPGRTQRLRDAVANAPPKTIQTQVQSLPAQERNFLNRHELAERRLGEEITLVQSNAGIAKDGEFAGRLDPFRHHRDAEILTHLDHAEGDRPPHPVPQSWSLP